MDKNKLNKIKFVNHRQVNLISRDVNRIRKGINKYKTQIRTIESYFGIKFDNTKVIKRYLKDNNIITVSLLIIKHKYGSYIYKTNKYSKLIW